MAEEDAFEAAIEEARRLEKKVLEYAPFEGKIDIESTLEFEPKEYIDLNYDNLIILYQRSQKIISTRELGILAAGPTEEKEVAAPEESEKVEIKLREMTSETLKKAEEITKEPIIEIEEEAPPEKEITEIRIEEEIEFEKLPEEKEEGIPEIEIEKPEISEEIEFEKLPEEKPKIEEEKPKEIEAEVPKIKKAPPIPPPLRETPDEAASRRYEQMEEQVRTMVGENADKQTLKKKMLELTKQLFKEKSTQKREEIKLQITVIKNILVGAGKKKKRKKEDETHSQLFDTILSAQEAELARAKDEIINRYNEKITSVKKKFYEDITIAEDATKRKQTYEGFVFSVTSLVEQLPQDTDEKKHFLVEKHTAEIEKLKDSVGEKEREMLSKVEERLEYITGKYDNEFATVKGILGREIDNIIEVTGSEIFKKAEEKPKEARTIEIIKEIEETDEGTLLYYLHSKDSEYYKQYERKKLSKAEAIFKAKALMAKEKGLSDDMIKKHFSQTEE